MDAPFAAQRDVAGDAGSALVGGHEATDDDA
jgi:hypothetical protein